MRKIMIVSAIVAGFLTSGAIAQQSPAPQPVREGTRPTRMAANPYEPFEFMIGDWYSTAGPETIHQRLRYGPDRSYIQYSTFTAATGQPEKLHFEGVMVWNGKTKALDYVFAVEPGSGVQEKGTVHTDADGSVTREVEFTDAKGTVAFFRQRFWRTDDVVMTSLMRKTETGWALSFPGSDKIVMRRQP